MQPRDTLRAYSRRSFLQSQLAGAALLGVGGLGGFARAAGKPEAGAAQESSIVRARSGRVRGLHANGVYAFLGVPYGAPTSGASRFMPPKLPEPWSGVRDALVYGPACVQSYAKIPKAGERDYYDYVLNGYYPSRENVFSEDCLNLNVWTTGLGSAEERPVMVWFHGGGYFMGSGNSRWFDGTHLAKNHDVVVVTVNHRLNVFGYYQMPPEAGPALQDSGNAGMFDLIASLQWVHDNISKFGGDRDRVTIFGESGGAGKVCALAAMPAAKGLFHRFIAQSDSLIRGLDYERASKVGRHLFETAHIDPARGDMLQALPAEQLLALANNTPQLHLSPPIGGKNIPKHPFDPTAPSETLGIPFLSGWTKDDGAYDLGLEVNHDTGETVEKLIGNRLVWCGVDPPMLNDCTGKFRSLYLKDDNYMMAKKVLTALEYDFMRIASERKADQDKNGNYVYEFDWAPPRYKNSYGSLHTVEVPFVFGTVDAAMQYFDTYPDQTVFDLVSTLGDVWSSFARDGRPSSPRLPEWKPYTSEARWTMRFGEKCELVGDPSADERKIVAPYRAARIANLTNWRWEQKGVV
jgi:para-nitrobenzyl esterase